MKLSVFGIVGIIVFGFTAANTSTLSAFQNWPQFRGPSATGLTDGNPPIHWKIETGENMRWRSDIPGLGHSSPIVWNDRIFLTTAINSENEKPSLQTGWLGGTGKPVAETGKWTWQVLCIDRANGSILWAKDVAAGQPMIKRHLKATHANCTCATNGKYVIAFFGSEGLYCFDYQGRLIWKKDFGKLHSGPYNSPKLEWGFSSSPIIHENQVVVQCDCINAKFVCILNIETGKEIRRIERDDVATWSTPAVFQYDGQSQLVCNGYKQMAGYDFETGNLLWTLSGGGDVPVPTPLFADGKILLTNGHARSPTYAIAPSARGELTPDPNGEETLPDGLLWWRPTDGSYMPTPIAIGKRLYTCSDNGRVTVLDLENGEQVYRKRAGRGNFSASAVGTTDRIYISSEKGQISVFSTGDEFELLARNELNQTVMATPALAGDELFIRTSTQLICISKDE